MTNKEILTEILQEQKSQAKKQLQLSADFSTHINKTDIKFSEILAHLESNEKTNQKGIIEQVAVNKDDISSFKTDKKIVYFAGLGIAIISNFVFKIFWK